MTAGGSEMPACRPQRVLDLRVEFDHWRKTNIPPVDHDDGAIRQLEDFIRYLDNAGYGVARPNVGTMMFTRDEPHPVIDYDKHPPRPTTRRASTRFARPLDGGLEEENDDE